MTSENILKVIFEDFTYNQNKYKVLSKNLKTKKIHVTIHVITNCLKSVESQMGNLVSAYHPSNTYYLALALTSNNR